MGSGMGAGVGGKRLNTGAPSRMSVFCLGVTTGSSMGSAISTALGVSIGSGSSSGRVALNENENEERGV